MSTCKKIDNSQKILKLSPDYPPPRAKLGGVFYQNFHHGFMVNNISLSCQSVDFVRQNLWRDIS